MIETPPGASHRSPDGQWEWNGTQWIPAQPAPGSQQIGESEPTLHAAPTGSTVPPTQSNPVSPDRKHQWNGTAWVPVKKKGHLLRNLGIVVGGLFLVGIGAALASSGTRSTGTPTASVITASPEARATASAQATATASAQATAKASAQPSVKPSPAAPKLTNAQENAVRSARSYLSFAPFSRQGLIDQLSSQYGDGYAIQDATIAVDSLNVDWNAEAVQAAKNYLKLSGFSCSGLIEQLDSPYGDKFTVAQATYGAKQAGAC